MKINTAMQKLGGLLYPEVCLCCGDRGEDGLDLCRRCHERLPWIAHACKRCAFPLPLPLPDTDVETCGACSDRDIHFDRAVAPFLLDKFIQEAIYKFKSNAKLNYGGLLARLLAQHVRQRRMEAPDLLVPVPLHPKRLRWRGFNQAVEISRILSKIVHCSVSFRDVRRIRETRMQKGLSATQREANVKNAFALKASKSSFSGKRVAIIDDVMTTGSTVNEVAKCLRRAGAEEIHVWVVARVQLN